MATCAKIKENWLGVLIGFLMAILVFFFDPKYRECVEMIRAIPQLSTCIFGFLLTLLGIILQGNGPVIERMRNSEILFNRFIKYNKKIVILSLAISIIALLTGYVDYAWIKECLKITCEPALALIWRVFISFLTWSCVWLVVDMITFVNLFYILIKKPQ